MKHCFGVFLIMFFMLIAVRSHITGDKTYLSELKKLCEHAYMCFHDTVIVCGKSVNEARTFLDLCDLYEYSCEYNMAPSSPKLCNAGSYEPTSDTSHSQIFRHVKEDEGVCPNPKELGPGIG